jgi:hypothetical protein
MRTRSLQMDAAGRNYDVAVQRWNDLSSPSEARKNTLKQYSEVDKTPLPLRSCSIAASVGLLASLKSIPVIATDEDGAAMQPGRDPTSAKSINRVRDVIGGGFAHRGRQRDHATSIAVVWTAAGRFLICVEDQSVVHI